MKELGHKATSAVAYDKLEKLDCRKALLDRSEWNVWEKISQVASSHSLWMLTGKGGCRRDWKGSMKEYNLGFLFVSADFPEEAASEKLKGSFSFSDPLS